MSKKKNKPNFELLKDAYQIVGGIPEHHFKLDVVHNGRKNLCGTLACAIGWLASHPHFNERGLTLKGTEVQINGEHSWYDSAAVAIFNISAGDARTLFGSRTYHETYKAEELINLSDRELWLHRVRAFLRGHGQLKEQLGKKKK